MRIFCDPLLLVMILVFGPCNLVQYNKFASSFNSPAACEVTKENVNHIVLAKLS
jgi:hypothetical protein